MDIQSCSIRQHPLYIVLSRQMMADREVDPTVGEHHASKKNGSRGKKFGLSIALATQAYATVDEDLPGWCALF
jgi:hypothetical protein